jgi:hypothetical protein
LLRLASSTSIAGGPPLAIAIDRRAYCRVILRDDDSFILFLQ